MMHIREWFEDKAIKNSERVAIYFEDKIITYREFDANVNRAANFFTKIGLKKGDKVALLLPNCPEYLYVWFGLLKIGVIAAHVSTTFRGGSLQYLIDSSDSRVAVIDSELVDAVTPMRSGLTKLEGIVWFPDLPANQAGGNDFSYREVMRQTDSSPSRPELKPGEACNFLHTSGTTGRPKWCMQSAAMLIYHGEVFAGFLQMNFKDRIFNPLPLYHGNPQMFLVLASLSANASIITERRFSASGFWDTVRRYGATVAILHFAPTEFLKKQPIKGDEENHSLRVFFPANRDVLERFRIPIGICGWGSIELGMGCYHSFHLPLKKQHSEMDRLSSYCGQPLQDMELAILTEDDRPVKGGEIGEIAVRPRKPHIVFEGYYGSPEKTLETWRNLWIHSGDLGFLDEDGVLHFVRRMAESINIKGEWVDVAGLEDLLRSHPKVYDCTVVGVSDPVVGKEVKGCIQPREGESLEPEEIIAYCEGKIAHFMIPRYVEVYRELPRLGGTEKVAKAHLEALGVTNQTWDREKVGYKLKRD